jgi:hypothetical protein
MGNATHGNTVVIHLLVGICNNGISMMLLCMYSVRYGTQICYFFWDLEYSWCLWFGYLPKCKTLLNCWWENQVRYVGVSNETSWGVMEFCHAAKQLGLPKIVSIQNSYSLMVRTSFEGNPAPFTLNVFHIYSWRLIQIILGRKKSLQ